MTKRLDARAPSVLDLDDVLALPGAPGRSTIYRDMNRPEGDPRRLQSVLVREGARRFMSDAVDDYLTRRRAAELDAELDAAVYDLGPEQVGAMLKVSARTATRLMASDVIPNKWVGLRVKMRRARRADVIAYLESLAS